MHKCLTAVDETYLKLKTVGMFLDTLDAADLELTLALLHVGKGLLHDGNLLLHDSLSIADLPFEPVCCHGHKLLDLCLHLFAAEIEMGWATARPQVLISELLQGIKVTAPLVVLEVTCIAILDGRVALDAMLLARFLAIGCAVNIHHSRILGHQFVPIGLQLLAMTSPRCLELYQDLFPGSLGIPVGITERVCCGSAQDRGEGQHTQRHGLETRREARVVSGSSAKP